MTNIDNLSCDKLNDQNIKNAIKKVKILYLNLLVPTFLIGY
jgi:hypothetical protein